MKKINKLLKPIANLLQSILYNYGYRALKMTYGSVSFIRESRYMDIRCPLENKNLNVAEIGVFRARNSEEMMNLLNIKKLYLIDPYDDFEDTSNNEMGNPDWREVYNDARGRMSKFGNKIVFIKKYSNEAVNYLPNEMDYIYIDGNHDYEYVKSNIENYFKKVRRGGILAGHDINIPDVLRAVLEFTKKHNLNFFIRKDDWIIIKKSLK